MIDHWDDGEPYDNRPDDDRSAERPYIGVMFECCGVYARVYRRPGERQYRGRCPRCYRTVHVRVGPGGTSTRLFRAQ